MNLKDRLVIVKYLAEQMLIILRYFAFLPLYEDKFGVSIPDLYTIQF